MNSLRILWALFRKNNSHPGFWGSLLLLSATLVPAIIDIYYPAPADWVGEVGWLTFLATCAGAGGFAIDTRHNSTRFIEYLPIRRWHIWLANWFDGFVWLLIVALLVSAYRTLHWKPPVPNKSGEIDLLQELLLGSRFSLLLTMLAFPLCAYSVSSFYRTITERDVAAIVRGVVATMMVIGLVIGLPQVVGLLPSFDEMAIPLLAIALAYSLLSLALFVIPVQQWHIIFCWMIRTFSASLLYAITLGMVYVCCLRWVRFEPANSDRLFTRDIGRTAYVQVMSRRSGTHLVEADLSARTHRYLGRGLAALKIGTSNPDSPLALILSELPRVEIFLDSLGLFPAGPKGDRFAGLPREPLQTEDGALYLTRGNWQTVDGETFVVPCAPKAADRTCELCLCDKAGRISFHTPMEPGGDVLLRSDGTAFTCAPSEPSSKAATRSACLLIDIRTQKLTKVQLPGELMDCAPDLSLVLCLVSETRNEIVYRRIIVVELPTGKDRAVIGEDLIPPVPYSSPERVLYGGFYRSFHRGIGAANRGDLAVIVDNANRYIAWTAALNAPPGTIGIRLFDLSTGQHRTLVSPDELGRAKGMIPLPQLIGFTPASDALLFENAKGIHRVQLADGSQRLIAAHSKKVGGITWSFSPDRTRVIATHSRCDSGEAGENDYTQVRELWHDGECSLLSEGNEVYDAKWLSSREIALIGHRDITIQDVTTGQRRCGFSASDVKAQAAFNFRVPP